MTQIQHVRARPGGLITLRLDARGHATRPLKLRGYVDLVFQWVGITALIGFLPSFLPVWWADARGLSGGEALPYLLPVAFCLLALLVVGIYVGAGEIIGMLLFYLVVSLTVLCFPLLLIPRVRRWVWRSGSSEDGSSREVERERRKAAGFSEPVHPSLVSHARLTKQGRRVTVTLHHVDGDTVAYSARGQDGEYLRAAFRDHLGDRLREATAASGSRTA